MDVRARVALAEPGQHLVGGGLGADHEGVEAGAAHGRHQGRRGAQRVHALRRERRAQVAPRDLLADGERVVRGNVERRVDELEGPRPRRRLDRRHLVDDVRGRAQPVARALDRPVQAVVAGQGTAALGLDRPGAAELLVVAPVDPALEARAAERGLALGRRREDVAARAAQQPRAPSRTGVGPRAPPAAARTSARPRPRSRSRRRAAAAWPLPRSRRPSRRARSAPGSRHARSPAGGPRSRAAVARAGGSGCPGCARRARPRRARRRRSARRRVVVRVAAAAAGPGSRPRGPRRPPRSPGRRDPRAAAAAGRGCGWC